MKCPKHGCVMACQQTRYGPRYYCNAAGCTVVCWNGHTSSPADAETRALRSLCHDAFDPLWQGKGRFPDRDAAYRWLRETMNLPKDKAHIGMFDRGQCERLLAVLNAPPSSAPELAHAPAAAAAESGSRRTTEDRDATRERGG